jgi:hypothetical protein
MLMYDTSEYRAVVSFDDIHQVRLDTVIDVERKQFII